MVYTIARSRRLRAVFSHAQVAPEVEQCRVLVDVLLQDPQLRRGVPPGGLVTLDVAWRTWLVGGVAVLAIGYFAIEAVRARRLGIERLSLRVNLGR